MYFIRKLVGEAHNILVIGDWWGRDYWSLRLLGKEVFALDIAPQNGIDRLVLADVTQPLPFKDRTFDAVVMSEVLEHLVDDRLALENIRKVLTPEGSLILSVPFLHDDPEVHVRVHTPRSTRRLLNACGFEVEKSIQRGITALDYRIIKLTFHLINVVNYSLRHKTNYRKIFIFLCDVSWRIGQLSSISKLLRFSKCWGAYLKC
jgi:SAM-dependent methyltransferase